MHREWDSPILIHSTRVGNGKSDDIERNRPTPPAPRESGIQTVKV
jgi:hypothetical protein